MNEKEIKFKKISNEIKRRVKLGLKIYAVRDNQIVSMTMRYIQIEFENSIYFVADYDFCKTPKRFSTYDFLSKELFFTANEGWKVEKNKALKHLKHIKEYMIEDNNLK